MKEIEAALTQAKHYVEAHIDSDLFSENSPQDLACYYKLPMFFIELGNPERARQTLDFICRKFLMQDGDFRTAESLKSEKPEYQEFWTYLNGWILRAANLLNYPLPPEVHRYFESMHLGHGIFSTNNPANTQTPITDILTNAHYGVYYLELEKLDKAAETVRFLAHAFDAQPDLGHRFLLRFHQGQAISTYTQEQQLLFSIEVESDNQLYFMAAYPAAFLAMYHKKTGDTLALKYAKYYMDFLLGCNEHFYSCRFSHKTAWAASILFSISKEPKYLAAVQQIVRYFGSIQSEEGVWFQQEGPLVYWDQSAEIGCWFTQIKANLATRLLPVDALPREYSGTFWSDLDGQNSVKLATTHTLSTLI
jgi:hypothetical protein